MPVRPAAKLGFALLAAIAGGPAPIAAGDGQTVALEDFEKRIAATPDDLELRSRALEAYFLERSPDVRAARARHALWVIANEPRAEVAGSPYAAFHRILDPSHYEQARGLWLAHVEKEPLDPELHWNAARFFFTEESDVAARFLKQGMKLEPTNPRWKEQLAHLMTLAPSVAGSESAGGASPLSLRESALAEREGEDGRYYALDEIAEAALKAGDEVKARAYAEELLALSERLPRDWHYGNAVHDGNRILGHLALRAGDVEAAKAFLLKAGATPGSPQLNSFGPELTLASDLLAKGQRDAVIQYLRMCGSFWKDRGDALDRWIAEIHAGGTPELVRFLALRSEAATVKSVR